jgi:hypothetical protein
VLKSASALLKLASHQWPYIPDESFLARCLRQPPEFVQIVREAVLEPADVHQPAVRPFLLQGHGLHQGISQEVPRVPLERWGFGFRWHSDLRPLVQLQHVFDRPTHDVLPLPVLGEGVLPRL